MPAWLLSKTVWYVIGAALIAGVLLWYHHHVYQSGWDARDADFTAFKTQVDATGKAAAAEAQWVEHNNEMRKETADAEHDKTKVALAVAINGLRAESDNRSFSLPAPTPGTRRLDVICFDRAEYQREIGESLKRLRGRIRELADEGTASTLDLNTAKKWAQQK